jgi:hypothetical protein
LKHLLGGRPVGSHPIARPGNAGRQMSTPTALNSLYHAEENRHEARRERDRLRDGFRLLDEAYQ